MDINAAMDELITAHQTYENYLNRADHIKWSPEEEARASAAYFDIRRQIAKMCEGSQEDAPKMRVSWIPQVFANIPAFHIPVKSPEEAVKVMTILSAYDQLQFETRSKPDFCNCGSLEVYDEELHEWIRWKNDDDDGYYDDVDEYVEEVSPQAEEIAAFNKAVLGQVHCYHQFRRR